ncbi:MAG: bifunctional molybdenum cofactor biosynthesis protein MoaC/MoaB [Candidatus Obscuribacterales bacterium]|nr:bifunctional molybdenum cofactor biosynthesis protein MoaC/MoaB [Candidatus Obscuribacterales bacterium]
MRDISHKVKSLRIATARATLLTSPSLIDKIKRQEVPKGDPLPVARVAAIQAAKNTASIIPYCHPLPIDYVRVDFDLKPDRVEIDVQVKAIYKTGVEMEAMTAASVAALTIYDMLKVFDESMAIVDVKLLSKKGGKSDFKSSENKTYTAAVLTISDSVSKGKNLDESGRIIVTALEEQNLKIVEFRTVSDDPSEIQASLIEFADKMRVDVIITTGGTGIGPRDNTPEVMSKVVDREMPGIAEAARAYGQERMPKAMLSRARSGVRGKTLIINFPGSPGGVREGIDALFPHVLHVFHILGGGGHDKSTHHHLGSH